MIFKYRDIMSLDETLSPIILAGLTKFKEELVKSKYGSYPAEMFDALTCFTFNLGAGNLANSTLLKKLNQKDYEGAAEEFEKWIYAGGKVLAGLVRRRKAERALFEGNDWEEYIV